MLCLFLLLCAFRSFSLFSSLSLNFSTSLPRVVGGVLSGSHTERAGVRPERSENASGAAVPETGTATENKTENKTGIEKGAETQVTGIVVVTETGPTYTPVYTEVARTHAADRVAPGDSVVKVHGHENFEVGMRIEVDEGELRETRTVVDFGSLIVDSPFEKYHERGCPVKGFTERAPEVYEMVDEKEKEKTSEAPLEEVFI